MENYDGLWELRTFYDTTPSGENQMSHTHTIDVNVVGDPLPGTAFLDIDCRNRLNGLIDLDSAATTLIGLFQDFLADTSNILRCELWKYDAEPSQNATFISVLSMGVVGATVTGSVAAQQATM